MFVEEITKIKESEAKADELLKKAKAEAKQSLRESKSEAEKIIEEAEHKAKEIYDQLITEGKEEADGEYRRFLDTMREQCDVLIDQAKENEDKAVELIAERIVRDSVDN